MDINVPSPCISICAVDEITGYCKGCFRTMQEVASWLYYSDSEKQQVMERLAARRQQETN